MQFIRNVKRTSLPLMDQANITIYTSVERKCVLILLKSSQLLDSDYRTLATTHKVGNYYRRKWLLYAVFAIRSYSTQDKETQ